MSFVAMNGKYEKPRVLYYVKYHDQGEDINGKRHDILTKKIDCNISANVCGFVGSSNGLICLSVMTTYCYGSCSYGFAQPLYICNPITKEFVILSEMCFHPQGYEELVCVRIVYGFGYHSRTGEYKVVRIRYVGDRTYKPQTKGLVEVYTLGSGRGWRSKGEISCYVWPSDLESGGDTRDAVGVCVDGALHWLPQVSTEILVFDLAAEEFRLLSTPPSDRFTLRTLCVIRECLCLVYDYQDRLLDFDIWFLKKKNLEENESSHNNWTRGFSLPYECWIDELFALLPTSDEALLARGEHICCYNLETKTYKENWILSKDNLAVPISHNHSFVSLKALGESNVNMFAEVMAKDDRLVSQGQERQRVAQICSTSL